jgi:hypothetical protein
VEVEEERVIVITSAGDAMRHLRALQRRSRDIKQATRIEFDGWPFIAVNVKGRRYHSSLPTPLMKALLDYQGALNRIYADTVYGMSAKSLDGEDRRATELMFVIKEGSSDSTAQGWQILNNLAEKLAGNMNSKHSLILLLGISLMIGGYLSFDRYLDHVDGAQKAEQAQLTERNRHALEMGLLRQYPELEKANEELSGATLGIVRAVPDASGVKVGVQKYKRSEIEAISETARTTTVPGTLSGHFVVKGLVNLDSRWLITLVGDDGETEIKTDLYKSEQAFKLMPILQDSFAKESPVFLELKVRKSGDKITQARIQSPEVAAAAIPRI